ncbi:MAG: UDP-N-acetylglucosamine--N-acetylmuramyl-(pentapeptide) pyrophosphoryl-undecaprenol N-acetylglucosamine transferase [Candidatus Daviesbacteria bacterium]|nr:UDP-N-acetylglucosamine--N-acetylmuramyl-(pentapeptide) pyrophosphoryl-undecaprenol N-acetylglucosamine transferase [Candidatus Daviesbacteria bacterium]
MKILITGTHLTPSLAVINELQKVQGVEIVYIGRSTTMEGDNTKSVESQVLKELGVNFLPIISGRLQRTFTFNIIPSLLKIPLGIIQSAFYLFKEKPDVVLSMGGYISVPVTICAWFYSIPIIIHEQTLIPGLANTINSWFADRVAVSFSENTIFNRNKTILTGNPLRKEVLDPQNTKDEELKEFINLAKKDKQPLILITGGNQGSHIINQTISKSLEDLLSKAYVIHQTGDSKYKDFESLNEQRKLLKNPEKYLVRKWINGGDWGIVLKNTNLAISRAGINTLLELAYFSIPTIVIPLLSTHNKEQCFNAEFFKKSGLVKIIFQNDLNPEILNKNIEESLNNLSLLKQKAQPSKQLVIPDAASRLALEVIILAKKPR